MRILLAEDDPLLGDAIAAHLRRAGHAADWVRDGVTADGALKSETFDIAILDLGLPRLSGRDVLRRMRERSQATPVLIVTAADAIADRVAGLDAGADDYLVKPVSPVEVRARIRSGFRAADAQRQLAERLAQLELALKRVSSLESLLPLCMYCRRINSDEAWQSVEDYLWEHVDVRVSHGCCPDCLSKLSRQLGGG